MSGPPALRRLVAVLPHALELLDHVEEVMGRKYSFALVPVDRSPGGEFGHDHKVADITLLMAVCFAKLAIELRSRCIWCTLRALGFGRGFALGPRDTAPALRALLPDFDRFINSVTAENRMFETRQKLIGGSQSAERLAEDASGNPEAAGHAIKAGAFMAAGEPIAGGLSAMKALGALMRGESPDVNAAASRILFTPQSMTSPTVFQNLRQVVEAQQARTRPRLLSIPASGAVGSNPVPILSTLPALGIPGLGSPRNQ
jgi:hypothetical protein